MRLPIEELECNLTFLEGIACGEITALVTQLKVYVGTDLHSVLDETTVGSMGIRTWEFTDHPIAQCLQTVMDSADTITASYNEFARVRRMGGLTYSECLELQKLLNAGPIAATRHILEEIIIQNTLDPAFRVTMRRRFEEVCEDFLRVLWLTESLAKHRPKKEGIKLLSPISLC